MDSENTTGAPAAVGPSNNELLGCYVFFVICSLICLIGNGVMALGIARCHQMRSRFYCILKFLLIGRVLMGYQAAGLYIYHSVRIVGIVYGVSRLACGFVTAFVYPGTIELVILLFLAVDRALALFAITFYRKLNARQASRHCTILFVCTFVFKVCLMFFNDAPLSTPVKCGVFDSLSSQMAIFSQYLDLAMVVTILSIYIGIMLGVRLRVQKHIRTPENEATAVSLVRQMAMMPTVRNIVIVHCVWTLTAKILMTIALSLNLTPGNLSRVIMMAGSLNMLEFVVNIIVLLWTNKDVRKVALNSLRKTQVGTVTN